jgi:2-methylfumaryl-CoA hydratase
MTETVVKVKGREAVVEVGAYEPRATDTVEIGAVVEREYGHYLEDFTPGRVFRHPRGVTLERGSMLAYAKTFMEANPLYLNEPFAKAQGFDGLPAAPHLVMNLALSLGVQNDSEKAIANLGYWDVRFLRPVYAGDTLTGMTRVVDRKDRGVDKPGIITVETLAQNQDGRVVVQYRRKIMVPRKGTDPIVDPPTHAEAVEGGELGEANENPATESAFPWKTTPKLHVPFVAGVSGWGLTSEGSCFSAFAPHQVWLHGNGRTVTDEHFGWTYQVMNTHPLHYDRLYSSGRSGPMSGEPIVYGGLVFAWLLGLASRDVGENVVAELGFHAGFHTQPTVAGDTLYALTRVLAVEDFPSGPAGVEAGAEPLLNAELGVVRMQLVGLKNLKPRAALDRYGADIFVAEDDKKRLGKEKIPEKVFEIERSVVVRRRPA